MQPSLPNADGAFVRCWEDREINTHAPTPQPRKQAQRQPYPRPAWCPHTLCGATSVPLPRDLNTVRAQGAVQVAPTPFFSGDVASLHICPPPLLLHLVQTPTPLCSRFPEPFLRITPASHDPLPWVNVNSPRTMLYLLFSPSRLRKIVCS